MAFGKGTVVTEAKITRFVGVGNFKIHGVNLPKEKLSELYGKQVDKDLVTTKEIEIDGVKYPAVNLNFTLSAEINGKTEYFTLRYSIIKNRVMSQEGKTKVTDEYGRTAWVTDAEFANHSVPMYSNGPANITTAYRALYRGEELVTMMLKSYVGIPSVEKWEEIDGVRKVVGMIDNPAEAEARLAKIENYFNGDFSELSEILTYQPENTIKLALGVRKDDRNNLWQEFFVEYPMRSNTRNRSKLQSEIESAKSAGKYANTYFEICDLKEYVESPTDFNQVEATAQQPAPANNPWFKS